ncbi:MAG TPA: exodeoxyribonuclease VII large subunit [Gemmatimonadaceae bacterium]|nr:exodeoxyribonuclease VII large subunit [Gemmatimonadaceae bacterium]
MTGEPRPARYSAPELLPPSASQRSRPNETSRSEQPAPPPGATPATAFGVSALTAEMRAVIEGAFTRIWVRGEISDFKRVKSGQWYFSLRDREATIGCIMWAQDARRLPVPPDEGMEVLAFCEVRMYAKTGQIQIVVRRLQDVGDGLWRKAFALTRQRLEADGLLDPRRKRPLPLFPRCVAIITSEEGAVLHDIVTAVRRRCPSVELVLIPALVQGDEAPRTLRRALARLRKWGGADVLIIGRGGGSREDLWAFNDEELARRLAACPIPTISAVGHEVDTTICDLVADHRAATPTAAAERAVPVLSDLRAGVANYAHILQRQVTRITALGNERLLSYTQRLRLRAEHALVARRLRLEACAGKLHALSPLATLGRGYAAVFDSAGKSITAVQDLQPGDDVNVRMRDGSFGARVESTLPGEVA